MLLYFFLNKTLFSTGVTDNWLFVYTINSHILHSPDFDSVALITCMHELSTEAWKISLYSPLMSSKPGPISGCDVNRSTNHAGEPSLKVYNSSGFRKEEEVKKGTESIISHPTPVLNCEWPQWADHREAENNMLAGFFCMLCPASFRVVFSRPSCRVEWRTRCRRLGCQIHQAG